MHRAAKNIAKSLALVGPLSAAMVTIPSAGAAVAAPTTTATENTAGAITQPAQARVLDEALRFNLAPSGTTFVAGASSSSADTQWRNKFSVEQSLTESLKVTTSVEEPGTAESRKSITAGFKKVW